MLNNTTNRWLMIGLLLAVSTYAMAEEITLTTYYPSPRGVYQELRTAGDVGIGDITAPPGARLHVTQTGATPAVQVTQTGAADALRIEDQAGDLTPFVINQAGAVGIGTAVPNAAAPNGQSGNLDVNDVYVRSEGAWASQSLLTYVGTCVATSESSCQCGAGERFMMLTGLNYPGTVTSEIHCRVRHQGTINVSGLSTMGPASCTFACFK